MSHPRVGGMTEQKKSQRRKELAKWLKENILRLGPTFIKIGQQFSTRVDILAQEYVDQLSELQVNSSLLNFVNLSYCSDIQPKDLAVVFLVKYFILDANANMFIASCSLYASFSFRLSAFFLHNHLHGF